MYRDPEYRYALHELKIDESFERLHVFMPEVKRKRLEQNIHQRGVSKPIITWHGFIVDGHKRYEIYHRRGILFPIRNIDSWSRYDVMEWLCDKNLKRFDLTDEYRKYFIGKKYLIQIEKSNSLAAEDSPAGKDPKPLHNRYLIAREMGEIHNVSHSTVLKYSQYAEAIDAIYEREPAVVGSILTGQVRVSIENVIEISRLSNDDLSILKDCFRDKNRDRVIMSEIWHELQWNRVHPSVAPKKKQQQSQANVGIKKMPKYDPDSELMSLTLTIPMWKSSLERLKTTADFEHSSTDAREKLLQQLSSLGDSIYMLSSFIEEGYRNDGNAKEPGSVCAEGSL